MKGALSAFLALASQCHTPTTIVDLGCGKGRAVTEFAASGAKVVGLDINRIGISRLRNDLSQTPNLSFVCADMVALDDFPSKSFCAISAHYSLHMLGGKSRASVGPAIGRLAHERAVLWLIDDRRTLESFDLENGGWRLVKSSGSRWLSRIYCRSGTR